MKFFKKGELKLLWPFYLDAIISPMLFFIPVFLVLYFRDLNFSLFQIGLLVAAAPLTSLLFEIPTGAFADLYGRKKSVILGVFLQAIPIFLLYYFTTFTSVFLLFALMGFGGTFVSGAVEAWVADLVKDKGKHLLKSYFVKVQSLDSFGLVISGFIGAWFVKLFGLSIIWLTAGASLIITVVLLAFARENFTRKKVSYREVLSGVFTQSQKAIRFSKRHKIIYYFFVAGMFLSLAGSFGGSLSWIPFLEERGMPDYAFGFLWSGMAALGIFAPIIANRLYREGRERKFILGTIMVVIIITLLVYFAVNLVVALSILLAIAFFEQFKLPAQRTYFQAHIPSEIRASVGSVEGMIYSFVGIFAPPLAGLTVDVIGAQYTILISGFIMIPAAIAYYYVGRKKTGKRTGEIHPLASPHGRKSERINEFVRGPRHRN